MKLIEIIKQYFTRECEREKENLISEISELNEYLHKLELKEEKLREFTETLTAELEAAKTQDKKAEFWNNKWKKSTIRYRFQGEFFRDARTLINYPSYIAQDIVQKYSLKKNSEELTILAIIKWCDKHIQYDSDSKIWGKMEYWQDSDVILQKLKDDCDGKSTVFKALCLAAGVPDYKVKVCAGWVKDPRNRRAKVGHAYPIYLWNNQWYVVDPTYYPDYTPFEERKTHKELTNYYPIKKPIWWSFSKEYCFAQKDIEL